MYSGSSAIDLDLPSMDSCLPDVDIHLPSFVPTPPHLQELERLGDQIAELAAHLDAATARPLDLIREFDAREGWRNGFRSCADWLFWRIGLSKNTARHHVRVARALEKLPRIAEAFAHGEISYSKVRAVTRVATPEAEERLLAVARSGTAEHVERIVRGWRRMDRKAEAVESARHDKSRALHIHYDDDGMVVISGRFAPEVGAMVMRAIEAARESQYPLSRAEVRAKDVAQEPPTMEAQRADALALIAETALHQGLDPGTPGERYQVVVHVDAAVLTDPDQPGQSVLEDGVAVPAGTAQRLACDASRVVMRHDDEGNLVEIGARTRTATFWTIPVRGVVHRRAA